MAAKRIGIAIVKHAGRYLVGVRGPEQALAGCAEFPGGKCEPEESPQECAVRECREETGLAVVAERLLEETTFAHPHGEVELHFWLCAPQEPAHVTADHRGFRWVTGEELRSLPFPEANRSLVEKLTAEARL